MQNTAFLFPGQGSQSNGMLAELSTQFPVVQETFAEASDVLGYDLWALTQAEGDQRLNQTEYTQPALLAAGSAVWRVWCSISEARPQQLAGHSLGEYTALVCAEALGFTDAIKLVALRGRLMQQAVPQGQGGMAAVIGMDDQQVIDLCAEVTKQQDDQGWLVSAANFNSPGQVVIAGQQAAVKQAIEQAKAAGARMAKLLPVSVPSHCGLMQSAAEQLHQQMLALSWQSPKIPVIHNVDAKAHSDIAELQQVLAAQLYRPVRWTDSVLALQASGIENYAECGPGKVLAGLVKRIGNGRSAPMYLLAQPESMRELAAADTAPE